MLIKLGDQLQKEGTGADVIRPCITYSTNLLTSSGGVEGRAMLHAPLRINMSDCANPSQSRKTFSLSLDVYLKLVVVIKWHESKRRDVGKTCRIHTGARWSSSWSADGTFRAPRGNG